MKKIVLAVAAIVVVGMTASEASAFHPTTPPFYQGPSHPPGTRLGYWFGRSPQPAFQAAPWYLYWPYNAHFQTPSPMMGSYYAPSYNGGPLVNPYFPAR